MEPWMLGKALSPFMALLMVWAIAAPIRRWLDRKMPDSKLKRLLFRRIN